MIKFYEKHIQGGQAVTTTAILIFVAIRLFFVFSDAVVEPIDINGGILWDELKQYIPSVDLSILLSGVFGVAVAMLLGLINNKYAIIRKRTSLPIAFVLLLFSINPFFFFMSAHYVAAIFLLLALDALFASYQESSSPRRGVDVGMYLAIASLFVTEYLIFLPLFIIGFAMLRSFSFKILFATLLPFILTYALVCGYFVVTSQMDKIIALFDYEILDTIYILSLDSILSFVIATLGLVFLFVLTIDNRMHSYKDKIKVRECVAFFHLILIVSFLIYCLSPILLLSESVLMPLVITLAFILARFWESATKKWKILSFFLLFAVYIYFVIHNTLTYFS